VREVFGIGEETDKGAALAGELIAESAGQHWVAGFERVEDRALRDLALDQKLHFASDVCQGS
jgi:hypothetical protein